MRPTRPGNPFDRPLPLREADWRDVVRVSEADLDTAEGEIREDLLAVWVRYGGTWHPLVLTAWRELHPGYWAARLQAGPGDEPIWVEYRGVSLQPVMPQVTVPHGALNREER